MRHIERNGFSFIQILIILVLVVILLAGIIYIVKPAKILEKSRDAERFDDMETLSWAINQYLASGRDFKDLVGPYSSIDVGFPSNDERQKADGTGWIPLNFIAAGVVLDHGLPLDPLNDSSHNYRLGISQSNKTYEIDCVFENSDNISKQTTDNGNNPNVYEIGTDLTIL